MQFEWLAKILDFWSCQKLSSYIAEKVVNRLVIIDKKNTDKMADRSTRSLLTSIYNSVQTDIENLAVKFRNKTDDLIETMLDISIDALCVNNLKNRAYMERLMRINAVNADYTLNNLGSDAMHYGDSSVITANVLHPSYAYETDYIRNFVEIQYDNTTEEVDKNPSYDMYKGGELYKRTTNLFPDDLNALSGTYSNQRWQTNNRNSILFKTKKLFSQGKINTLLSRFATGADGGSNGVTDGRDVGSQFGMSHGNNLLLKSAENGEGEYNINGYNNPYCRVWTHHYQYDRLNKLIRPFVEGSDDDDRSNPNTRNRAVKKSEFHAWSNFKISESGEQILDRMSGSGNSKPAWGWKNNTDAWDKSVLGDNGFVNITPKYDKKGSNSIHTRQCMFSIENLAWKGYDPYSFEKALSWEQRGPMGGRIMWFPPYGLKFNETTQVNWTNHTFIGRGEDVYTYTNTIRSGTLNFMMIVDHPSIIDYVSWRDGIENKDSLPTRVSDTDLLRFFAGCDYGTVSDAALPTPLVDEYTGPEYERTYIDPKIPEPIIEEEIPEEIDEFVFYVFYPNNYSGTYDHMGSTVEAIAYLLNGVNAQKKVGDNYMQDIPLQFDTISESFEGNPDYGIGYEVGRGLVSNLETKQDIGPIIGTSMTWSQAISKGIKTYPVDKSQNPRRWWYRIDGEYEVPTTGDKNRNTYDQRLRYSENYRDSRNDNSLNSSADKVKEQFKEEENNENLYSLLEVASALAHGTTRNFFVTRGANKERVEKLENIIKEYDVVSIDGVGYSNSHGNNTKAVNDDRNSILAIERIKTVVDWFNDQYKKKKGITDSLSGSTEVVNVSSEPRIAVRTQNVSDVEAKKYRSARMSVKLKKTQTKKLADSQQTTVNADGEIVNQGTQKYIGFYSKKTSSGQTYFEDEKSGNKWIEVTDENDPHYGQLVMAEMNENGVLVPKITMTKDVTSVMSQGSGEVKRNRFRYDQEYFFFRMIEQTNPIIWDKLMDKIRYFDPAFHSQTPEGFNMRLTFLQQCTRQGNTIGASDTENSTASNLAFGRPPFCVLRIGDFYNQLIVIDSITVDYDHTFDLNIEGIGVQPMLANVSIGFKFIGGGDLNGPIRRLQNAMTFNYYSNSRLYDNRADRIVYNEKGEVDYNSSEFFVSSMDKKEKNTSDKTITYDQL